MTELQGIEDYEVETWRERLGSDPVEVVSQDDRSGPYEIDRATILLLENGKYAGVFESGCSCYSSEEADIDLFPTKEAAEAAAEKWWKRFD